MPDMNGLKECFPVPTRFQEVTGRLWWDYEAGLSREEHLRNNRKTWEAVSKGGKLGSPASVCRVCSVC